MSMLVWIKLEKNGVSCGSRQIKCESRLRELDQILRASENPLEFMCQVITVLCAWNIYIKKSWNLLKNIYFD